MQIGPQNVFGYFGELRPRGLEALGADGPLAALEIILDGCRSRRPSRPAPGPRWTPALQPVERDFAFLVDQAAEGADIMRAAQGADRKLIAGVNVFDVYEGKGIDPAKSPSPSRSPCSRATRP